MLFAGALLAYQLSRALVIGDATDAVKHAWEIIAVAFEDGVDGGV